MRKRTTSRAKETIKEATTKATEAVDVYKRQVLMSRVAFWQIRKLSIIIVIHKTVIS